MLRLPHTGVTPDMLGEIQPLLGVVGLDKARTGARRRPRCPTRSPATSSRSCARHAATSRRPARRELSRAIHLLSAAKAHARLGGRDSVTLDDIRAMAPYVLRHRLICTRRDDARTRRSGAALDTWIHVEA